MSDSQSTGRPHQVTAYCTLLACFARCSVREQDAAFVYHNGIHVSERQHVEKLSGVNAGAIVEEREMKVYYRA